MGSALTMSTIPRNLRASTCVPTPGCQKTDWACHSFIQRLAFHLMGRCLGCEIHQVYPTHRISLPVPDPERGQL